MNVTGLGKKRRQLASSWRLAYERNRPRPRSRAWGANAGVGGAPDVPSRLSSCAAFRAVQRSARMGQGRSETAAPTYASRPWHGHQEHQAHPPETTRLYEALLGGAHWVAVDPFGGDLGSKTSLQRFINADHQWATGHECPHQQPQQHTTRLPPRPNGTVEESVVALEVLGLPKAHDAQRGTNGSLARSEIRSRQEHLDVRPYAF